MDEIQDLLKKCNRIYNHYLKNGCFFGLRNTRSVERTLERYSKLKTLGPRQSKKYEDIKYTINKIYTRLEKEGF